MIKKLFALIPSQYEKFFSKILTSLGAAVIIFALLFTLNNYVSYEQITIKSDGFGYYDYLPAIFIYGDMPGLRANFNGNYSDRIKHLDVYHEYKGKLYNKYPCGTAVLMFPFFTYAHLTAVMQGYEPNGFSPPYHKAVFVSAIFYLFLGLVFLRKLLKLFSFSQTAIFLSQLLVVFSTSIMNYVNFDASFSHIYSFFAITAFFYFAKSFLGTHKKSYFFLTCFFYGLILTLRQINGIVLFFIPFLAGNVELLKNGILFFLRRKLLFTAGALLAFTPLYLQLFFWKIQTGNFIFDSYREEGFNFLKPALYKILFSYRKGLFVYAPVLLVTSIGMVILLKKKKWFLFITWFIFFAFLTYLLSSWHSWEYGASFGLRAYIDFYSIFFILYCFLLDNIPRLLKIVVIVISLLTIPVSVIQAKQYKNYILHWNGMDKESYWTVFLRTEERFKGLYWKRFYNFNESTTTIIKSYDLKNILLTPNSAKEIFNISSDSIARFGEMNIVQVNFENEFNSEEDARVQLRITDAGTNAELYEYKPPLIHFSEKGLNKYQRGVFNYEMEPFGNEKKLKVNLLVFTKADPVTLSNVTINFIKYKK